MTGFRRLLAKSWSGIAWVWNHSLGFVLTVVLLALLRLYRLTFSRMLPPSCRYHPSCSAYALEAVQVHLGLKGGALAVWRLLRCNPFTKGGYDPVPTAGRWLPDVRPDGQPRSAMMGTSDRS